MILVKTELKFFHLLWVMKNRSKKVFADVLDRKEAFQENICIVA